MQMVKLQAMDDGVYPACGNPWGMVLNGRSGNFGFADDKYKFTGKERDVETKYDYFGARYYDSRIGRWLGVDSFKDLRPGLSAYNYVQNNPINRFDPDGSLDFSKIKDKYPKVFKAFENIDKRITQRMLDAWYDYGQATDKVIFATLYPGRGPIITPEDLESYGLYNYKERPNELQIDYLLFEEYEKGNIPYILLEAVIFHELTHYFDLRDGKFWQNGEWEAGLAFETWVYGKILTEENSKEYLKEEKNDKKNNHLKNYAKDPWNPNEDD